MRIHTFPLLLLRGATMVALGASAAMAQPQREVLDLRTVLPGTVTHLRTDGNSNVTIVVRNLVPKRRQDYTVTIGRETIGIPAPLELPEMGKMNLAAARCDALYRAAAVAIAAENEAGFGAAFAAFDGAVDAARPIDTCTADEIGAYRAVRDQLRGLSEAEISIGIIERGERVTAQLTRAANDKAPQATWSMRLDAPPASYWTPTFGLVALWRRSMPDGRRFTTPGTTAGQFLVQDGRVRRDVVDRLPVLMFNWIEREHTRGGFGWNGLAAGFGVDLGDPTLLIGSGLVFRDNVVLSVGAAVHTRLVPKDEYPAGAVVGEQLTRDQLHNREAGINPFLGITIRLGRNPFATQSQ